MAITARFEADFQQFQGAVASADASLQKFEIGSQKVSAELDNMGLVSTRTTVPVNTLRTSMGQFDGILSSLGVNMGPQVRAIGELGDVAGKSATSLGLLGTAGLAVGAGMAGWQVGRAISEVAGLDDVISRSAAALLGWGDYAAQVAGAKADLLAAASLRAGRAITDMAEAVAINYHAQEQMVKASEANKIALDKLTAATNTADAAAVQGEAIRINNAAQLARLAEELKSVSEESRKAADAAIWKRLAIEQATRATEAWASQSKAATDVIGKLGVKATETAAQIRTLSGQMMTAKEYAANQLKGGSVTQAVLTAAEYNALGGAAKIAALEEGYRMNPGRRAGSGGSTGLGHNDAQGYAALLAEQQLYSQLTQARDRGGANVNTTINVNGTAEDVARKVADEIARSVARGGFI